MVLSKAEIKTFFTPSDFHKQEPAQRCTTYDLVAIITHLAMLEVN